MGRVLIVTPPAPLVTVAEAKDHLKVDGDEQDALIEGFIAAVSGHLDGPAGLLGRAIGRQQLQARFDTHDGCADLLLPCPPILDLVSIEWLGADRQPVAGDASTVEMVDAMVVPIGAAPWAGALAGREALRVTYWAGYDAVPAPIRVAVLLMVDDLYRNRGTVTSYTLTAVPMPTTAWALLSPFRVYAQ